MNTATTVDRIAREPELVGQILVVIERFFEALPDPLDHVRVAAGAPSYTSPRDLLQPAGSGA